jgi:predicted component of type VI protein secretion system
MEVSMKVWRPDGTTVRVGSIASTQDHVGHMVAMGDLPPDGFWQEVARLQAGQMAAMTREKCNLERFNSKLVARINGVSAALFSEA